jgi:hypothetical protein
VAMPFSTWDKNVGLKQLRTSATVIKGGCQARPVSHSESPGPGLTRSQLPVRRRRRRRRPGCVSAPTEPAACRRGGHSVRRRRRRPGPGPCRGNVTVIVGRRCSWRFGAGPGPGPGRGRRTCVNAARRPGRRAAPAAGGESAATRSVTVTPLGSPGPPAKPGVTLTPTPAVNSQLDSGWVGRAGRHLCACSLQVPGGSVAVKNLDRHE